MSRNLDNLRDDHIQILAIIAEIRCFLDPTTVQKKASLVQNLVSRLTQKTLSHLLLEDRFLYQEMLISTHDETRNLAQQHIASMGSIASQLRDYIQTWCSQEDMVSLPEQFCVESRQMLEALQQRIAREEDVLYPKAEAFA
jgi:hypothetical protein